MTKADGTADGFTPNAAVEAMRSRTRRPGALRRGDAVEIYMRATVTFPAVVVDVEEGGPYGRIVIVVCQGRLLRIVAERVLVAAPRPDPGDPGGRRR